MIALGWCLSDVEASTAHGQVAYAVYMKMNILNGAGPLWAARQHSTWQNFALDSDAKAKARLYTIA